MGAPKTLLQVTANSLGAFRSWKNIYERNMLLAQHFGGGNAPETALSTVEISSCVQLAPSIWLWRSLSRAILGPSSTQSIEGEDFCAIFCRMTV